VTLSSPDAPVARAGTNWERIAHRLVSATLAYNVLEAAVAIFSGVRARSVALVGFGLDSVIECAAALSLLWRLSAESRGASRHALESAERRVHRFVGVTFLLLALYVVTQSAWVLLGRNAPGESLVGLFLAGASLIVMPVVSLFKLRAARKIGSGALRAEAKETLACSYLSFTLFLGLLANAVAGWWWADPVAALLMVPWLIREGREGVRGEECCDD
jgi:divalent metal cation (Fe/Co/Zn/Cd) transporter